MEGILYKLDKINKKEKDNVCLSFLKNTIMKTMMVKLQNLIGIMGTDRTTTPQFLYIRLQLNYFIINSLYLL